MRGSTITAHILTNDAWSFNQGITKESLWMSLLKLCVTIGWQLQYRNSHKHVPWSFHVQWTKAGNDLSQILMKLFQMKFICKSI